jgi:hypothetical protein
MNNGVFDGYIRYSSKQICLIVKEAIKAMPSSAQIIEF